MSNDNAVVLGIVSGIIGVLLVIVLLILGYNKFTNERAVGCAEHSQTAQQTFICMGGLNSDLVAAIEASK